MTLKFRAAAIGGLALFGLPAAALAQEPGHVPPGGIPATPAGEPVAAPAGEPVAAPVGEPGAAPGGEHAAEAGAEGEHAAEGGEHGGEHESPLHYTGDEDHDGTANWLDSDSENYVLTSLGFHFLNFVIYGGLALFFAGPIIRDGLRARAAGIKSGILEAAKLRDEAVARDEAVSKRLGALSAEIAEMAARAKTEAVAEEARIIERAQDAARRVGETAQRQIADEGARARRAIRDEAVILAVQLAEGILAGQVQSGDQKRLADEFLNTLKSEGRHV
jgi:F-type H+-transporting ATPase subunit b